MVNIKMQDGTTVYWSATQASPAGKWPAGTDEAGVFETFVNSADVVGASCFHAYSDSALTTPITIVLHAVVSFTNA